MLSASDYSFFYETDPVPASRPRVGKWGTYYTGKYADWKDSAHTVIPVPDKVFETPVIVHLEFVLKRPKKQTTWLPRGDLDNFEKAILDSLTKAGVWADDKLVGELHSKKRYTKDGELSGIYINISTDQHYIKESK